MRAVIFEKQGFDNLQIKDNVQNPEVLDYDVLIKVITAGVNPIDYYVISGYRTIQQTKGRRPTTKTKGASNIRTTSKSSSPYSWGGICWSS